VNNVGVSVTTVGDGSKVFVAVFHPTNVGVKVNVAVGVIGVGLGIGVNVFVALGNGVADGRGSRRKSLIEQDAVKSTQIRSKNIFFIVWELGILLDILLTVRDTSMVPS